MDSQSDLKASDVVHAIDDADVASGGCSARAGGGAEVPAKKRQKKGDDQDSQVIDVAHGAASAGVVGGLKEGGGASGSRSNGNGSGKSASRARRGTSAAAKGAGAGGGEVLVVD